MIEDGASPPKKKKQELIDLSSLAQPLKDVIWKAISPCARYLFKWSVE